MNEQTPNRITIHCSASPNGKYVSFEEIKSWHLARGFTDIGYHLVILTSGEVVKGRDFNRIGAHVKGANTGNIGICMVGTDKFRQCQWDALGRWVRLICRDYGIPMHQVWGHYQFASAKKSGKTCPNVAIAKLLSWIFQDEKSAIVDHIYVG